MTASSQDVCLRTAESATVNLRVFIYFAVVRLFNTVCFHLHVLVKS